MLMAALEAEVAASITGHRDEGDERVHGKVVRNGWARERKVTKGPGLRKRGLMMAHKLLRMARNTGDT